MSAIAGVYGVADPGTILDTMIERLKHRGPDDCGTYCCGEAALGHTRLSILDVAGGKQPIFNEDSSACIVFNGKIYNYQKLREQLSNRHRFITNTDTEVILHLFEDVGEECVRHLDGMFSFAIYDDKRGLMLARDPLGIKPLYIAQDGDSLYFASEMKALMDVVPDFDEFPAGHCYITGNGRNKYFSMPKGCSIPMTADEARVGIRNYLEKAVVKRLMSDVPIGVFLSGGLDSSIIAAIAVKHKPGIHTFSVGMEDSEDRKYALMVSDYLGTEHHEKVYTLDDMLNALPDVIYYLESYDAALVRSAVPNYFLAKLASQYVKVVLSGEGADELFSGYHYLKEINRSELNQELLEITEALHNTNLQRCDRMTMAHGIEGRVPFLDVDLLRFSATIPVDLKLGPDDTEKWILREAFKGRLPDEIVYRRKSKFSEGAGSSLALSMVAEMEITDKEFECERELPDGHVLANKEELMYYRIFQQFYPLDSAMSAIGFSRSL
ncbi:MAG TPA: asparagine synthase B [Armatimonadota bacterium]|nr:asparagine synthase B [Armatimonadota bacterium]HOP79224.1 asparagine synthase B [Armatimonadota bacterium]HPP74353.1 asparagine synthase B [Armatimonadota bacterium]